ncbi:methionine aminopeptidase 1D, mitochondrial-like [Patiria miniata]|uniref:Methionine aminopeptidase n=1 Tax=Patiria miniata TaxID=46514 RepID=A0A914A387_PATMI|nr:methionine aminopeptidase 1D, mitochondrial-like [Patiria miniata]
MAAPMKDFTRRLLWCIWKNTPKPIRCRRVEINAVDYGTRASLPTTHRSASSRTLLCSPCRRIQNAQHGRTLFGLFKNRHPAQPDAVVEDELPYRVVRPGKVSLRRSVPDDVMQPEYASSGTPQAVYFRPIPLKEEEMEKMRDAGKMARKILDIGASHVKPGVTTDFIDETIHAACLENNVYPSTLNYKGFPKSVCTSVNNVMVHGIPDDKPLEEGDIINIDFTVFLNGYHGDLSETYAVGSVDEAGLRLIDTARRCRDEAIKICQPQAPIAEIGVTIQKIAQEAGFYVCPSFVGHGIGKQFHCKPDIWHYANTYPEKMLPGMAFTIEPVVMETVDSFIVAEDGWTVLAKRHTRSAQFEHTILITEYGVEVPTASPGENLEKVMRSGDDKGDCDDFSLPASSSAESHHQKSSMEGDTTAARTAKNPNKDDWKFD